MFEIQQARTGAAKIGKRKRELREDIAMASRSNEAVEVVPNLEPLPKWALVQNILEVRLLQQCSHVFVRVCRSFSGPLSLACRLVLSGGFKL